MKQPMTFPRLLKTLIYYCGVVLAFIVIVLLVNESLELLQTVDRLIEPSPKAKIASEPVR